MLGRPLVHGRQALERKGLALDLHALRAAAAAVERAGGGKARFADDELLEVTPKSLRLRKRLLDPHERKKSERKKDAG